jgi:hypothetical protein
MRSTPGGYLHVVYGKGGKDRTSILPMPVLESLEAHIDGLDEDMSSRAEIMAISRLGRSNDCWMVLQRVQDSRSQGRAKKGERRGSHHTY